MSKPPFDPNQPFESAKPAFDPNQPFTSGDQAVSEAPQSMPVSDIAGQAAKSAITGPYDLTKSMIQNPEQLGEHLPVVGAVAGEVIGGPPGAAIGAGLGQIGKRMSDIAYGKTPPVEGSFAPKEAIGPMVQSAVAGLPGVSGIINPGKNTLSQLLMKGYAKAANVISGVKTDAIEQAARQGPSTYFDPSLKKASEIFGEAVGPEGKKAMAQTAKEAFDPALGKARQTAVDIGTKLENGEPVTAIEALQARQATDRVISSTSWKDKMARRDLFGWRNRFDNELSGQSGRLSDASRTYRRAIVRDQLLTPTRMNKSGDPSALLPMILGAAGPMAGITSGNTGKGVEAGLAGLAGTSPITWGLGATTLGALNPTVRQALLAELVDRLMSQNK